MKLGFSNIAWPPEADDAAAEVLRAAGVRGIEIAPTKLAPDPTSLSRDACRAIRGRWQDRGLPIVAAQALLFGRPELTLFGSSATRRATLDYLKRVVAVCADLGAEALVFGSPKNRCREALAVDEADALAVPFFRELAAAASDAGTCVVLEANPPEYGADYVTRAAEALRLVEAVEHPGLGLHLDTACMTLAGDRLSDVAAGSRRLRHFHVSEPQLAPVGPGGAVRLAEYRDALRTWSYAGWVSIEMRMPEPFSTAALTTAAEYVGHEFAD